MGAVSKWKQVGKNLVRHVSGSYYLRAKVAGKIIRVKLEATSLGAAKLQRDDELAALRAAAIQQETAGIRTVGDAIKVVEDRVLKGAHLSNSRSVRCYRFQNVRTMTPSLVADHAFLHEMARIALTKLHESSCHFPALFSICGSSAAPFCL